MQNSLNLWIQDLCDNEGLPPGEVDGLGEWNFVIGEGGKEVRVVVAAPSESSMLYYAAVVAEIPEDEAAKLALYTRLLGLNLFFDGTGGAAFAIDAAAGLVLLNYSQPLESVDAMSFKNTLEVFVECAQTWAADLAQAQTGTPGAGRGMYPVDALPPDGSVQFLRM